MEIQDDLGVELQGRLEEKDKVNVAAKEVNAAEPTVFDDEEVTITMAQILIKMKAKKVRLLDEKMAKRLHNKEVEQVKPIFEREYNKVQTFLKPDKDEEPAKKRGAEETLLQKSFKKLRAKVKALAAAEEEDEEDEVPATLTPSSPTYEPTSPSHEPIPSPLQTCTTLSYKVVALEQKKVAQALEILKLKRRVKKLEKQRRSKSSGLKRLRKVVFDDEEVTMTMAQILIKMKAEKVRLLDEKMAKRLHNKEVKQVAARENQKQDDFKRAQELQQQYDQKVDLDDFGSHY
nr:hypothetical protein [Tanacetum cinerariifolium]